LTDEGDLVLDIFAGYKTTGFVAENQQHHWLNKKLNENYLMVNCYGFSQE